jgi:hypothetical protein
MLIELNDPPELLVLAEIIGVPPTAISQLRREGKLPADTKAPLILQLKHYINWLKARANGRNAEADEKLLIAKTENLKANTQLQVVKTLAARDELIDPKILSILFQSGVLQLRNTFLAIGEKYPVVDAELRQAMEQFADYALNLLAANKGKYATILDDFEKEDDTYGEPEEEQP